MAAEITDARHARLDGLDEVVSFLAGQQQQPERNSPYLGDQPDGIRAELEALHPPWADTLRVVRDDGVLTGCMVTEWDTEIGRCWLYGPWIEGDDAAWERWARPLLDAEMALLPPEITNHELSGSLANERLRRLADQLGWAASEVNHAYVVTAAAAEAWPTAPDEHLRGVVAEDVGLIEPLHEAEFPSSYFNASQLVERAGRGEQIVVVACDDEGRFAGYAAGQISPDGTGYLDYVAVHPDARGHGLGRQLLVGIGRRLLREAAVAEVHLTVQDRRMPARALYEALGFRNEASIVGYRSP